MSYLWVALGGALGSVGRYAVGRVVARVADGGFPFATLLVNVSGSMLIGVLAGLATAGRHSLPAAAEAFLLIGVLGGFTTFSSFSLETLLLVRAGEWTAAVVNVLGSVALCLLAVSLGFAAASALSR
ncbi:MAG: fluoride efflux transporter CrcB [Gammaproteobacteria bacterium]|nr:fluoride efflux transporter CrcB [Gammaproteobacteria bacterium]